MWANINHFVQNTSKLRLFAAGLLLATLLGVVQANVANAADGSWTSKTTVKVGNSVFFNPKVKDNGPQWYVEENAFAPGKGCESIIVFSGDPTQDTPASRAIAAKGELIDYSGNIVDENGEVIACSKEDKRAITLTGSPVGAPTTPPPGPGTGTGDETGTAEPSCDVGSMSFAICPLINFMADATEWTANVLQGLLYIKPLSLDTNNVLYKAWASMLSVANVILAFAFLFVIFAQSTSMALSNYGVKKMLPRIIAAAILMNLSYYICAIAVDLSNLAGVGIAGFFAGILNGNVFVDPNASLADSFGNKGWTEIAAGAGVGAIIIFFFLIPVLLAALAVLFTLAARIAILVLLVMVSPLAFAAWILPNTEKYFKKWYDLFITMLMLFPLVMAVFAGASVASTLVQQTTITAGDVPGAAPTFTQTILLPLIALIIQALPLFALPFLFKTAGGVLGRINAITQGGLNKYGGQQANNAIANYRKGARQRQMSKLGARMAQNSWGKDAEGNPLTSRGARFRRGLGKGVSLAGNYKNARDTKLKEQAESISRAQQDVTADRLLNVDSDFAKKAAGVAGEAGMERVRSRAIESVMRRGNEAKENVEKMQQVFGRLSPFAAQAFASSVGSDGRFDESKLNNEISERLRNGQITDTDVMELNRVKAFGNAFTGAAMAGAAGSLARSGFLSVEKDVDGKPVGTHEYIRNAEKAIRRQYGGPTGNSPEAVVALDRLAESVNSQAKESGMAQNMRWGVVGGELIQNGQDFDFNGIENGKYNDKKAIVEAFEAYKQTAPNGPERLAALGNLAKAYEANVQTSLGFQKLPSATSISRKSFTDGGQQAFLSTMKDNAGFREDVILTAEGKGQMSGQDREALKKAAQEVIGKGAAWDTAVREAKQRAGLFTNGGNNAATQAAAAPAQATVDTSGTLNIQHAPAATQSQQQPNVSQAAQQAAAQPVVQVPQSQGGGTFQQQSSGLYAPSSYNPAPPQNPQAAPNTPQQTTQAPPPTFGSSSTFTGGATTIPKAPPGVYQGEPIPPSQGSQGPQRSGYMDENQVWHDGERP